MKFSIVLMVMLFLGIECVAQQELGSTSATTSIPTGSDRSQEIRAQGNPIVKLYSNQIRTLNIGAVEYLNKLDAYQKASSRASKNGASLLQVSDLSSTSATLSSNAQEPPILVAARELLIAYGVSEEQKVNINELIRERAKTPGVLEAVANILSVRSSTPGFVGTSQTQTLNMELIAPEVKTTAVNSILSACKILSFACKTSTGH